MKDIEIPKWNERSIGNKFEVVIYNIILITLFIDCFLPNVSYAKYIMIPFVISFFIEAVQIWGKNKAVSIWLMIVDIALAILTILEFV